jgi:acyl-CoA thioesterase I
MIVSRRKFCLFLTLLFALLVWWLWPGHSWRFNNLPPAATGPWVAFGDSLTEGYGANPGADYPAQLSQRLGIAIQNLGVSGDTTADGLKRIETVETLQPRVVLLCFGGNDVLQGLRHDRMLATIGEMIDRLQARGSFVVLIGIRGRSLMGDANADGFKQLAREKKVKHVSNILDGLLSQPSLMSDYVHPNDAGYGKIAERLEKELRPLLPKLRADSEAPRAARN